MKMITTLNIEKDLLEKAKLYAAKTQRSFCSLVRHLLVEYIANEDRKNQS